MAPPISLVATLLFINMIIVLSAPIGNEELLFVHVIWRHGDRAPLKTYPTDEHQEVKWPVGFGELTELGMKQQYEFGQYLRERYINRTYQLLKPRYNSKEVYIRSTDVDRVLVSAQSNLAGMYPAGVPDIPSNQRWPRSWTPIPIHTVPKEDEYMGCIGTCPRVRILRDEIRAKAEKEPETVELLKYLSTKTGWQMNLEKLRRLYNTYFVETIYNMTQPDWMTPELAEKIRPLADEEYRRMLGVSKDYSFETIRLLGGSTLKAVLMKLKQKASCHMKKALPGKCANTNMLKYYAFSAHDFTITGMMSTLLAKEEAVHISVPEYTASIAVELWDIPKTGLAVKVLYRKSVGAIFEPITRRVSGCPKDTDFCPLTQFMKRSVPFLPKDIRKECDFSKVNEEDIFDPTAL